MFCPKCGKENESGSLFCISCGERLTAAESVPATAKRKKGIVIGAVASAVIVIAVLTAIVIFINSKSKVSDLPMQINWSDSYETVMKKDKNAGEPVESNDGEKLRDKIDSITQEWCQFVGFSESYGQTGTFEYVYNPDGNLEAVNLTWNKTVSSSELYNTLADKYTWDDPSSTDFAWFCKGRNDKVSILFLTGPGDNIDILITPLEGKTDE